MRQTKHQLPLHLSCLCSRPVCLGLSKVVVQMERSADQLLTGLVSFFACMHIFRCPAVSFFRNRSCLTLGSAESQTCRPCQKCGSLPPSLAQEKRQNEIGHLRQGPPELGSIGFSPFQGCLLGETCERQRTAVGVGTVVELHGVEVNNPTLTTCSKRSARGRGLCSRRRLLF